MRTRVRTLIVISLSLTVLATGGSPVNATSTTDAKISTVESVPSAPVPNESVTISATIRNPTGSLVVHSVRLMTASQPNRTRSRLTDLGTLSSGARMSVPLRTVFSQPGSYTLKILVNATTSTGHRVNLTAYHALSVNQRQPTVAIDLPQLRVGTKSTATVTIANGINRDLRNLALSLDGLATVNDTVVVSQLPAGRTIDLSVPVTPKTIGQRRILAQLNYTLTKGPRRSLSESTHTTIQPPPRPKVGLSVEDPIVGVETPATVTIANGLKHPVQNVVVTISGVHAVEHRRVLPEIQPGEETALDFKISPNRSGPTEIDATVDYSVGTLRDQRLTISINRTVQPYRGDLQLTADSEGGQIQVTVANFGNAPITDLVINGSADSAIIGSIPIGKLTVNEQTTVSLPITGLDTSDSATVLINASYSSAGTVVDDRHITSDQVRITAKPPAQITLTGLSIEWITDTRVRITGSASNTGLTDAHSVIVHVKATDGVTPAPPNRDYFVGTIPGSDFVSFEVYATLTGNSSRIPLGITYLADGTQQRHSVNITAASRNQSDSTAPDSGFPPEVIGGLAIVLLVLAILIGVGRRGTHDNH